MKRDVTGFFETDLFSNESALHKFLMKYSKVPKKTYCKNLTSRKRLKSSLLLKFNICNGLPEKVSFDKIFVLEVLGIWFAVSGVWDFCILVRDILLIKFTGPGLSLDKLPICAC